MSTYRLAGLLIIAGLALALIASFVFPPAYYMAEDPAERAQILSANRAGWVASCWLYVAAGIASAAGILLIARRVGSILAVLGGVAFALGAAFWAVYAARRAFEPEFAQTGLWMESVFAWLAADGLVLLGVAFLRSDWPRWVGYVSVGYGVAFGLAGLLAGSRVIDFFPPQLPFLVACAAGVSALRRR